ncbi:MAG: universal stress protein [Nitrospirae bacterium]|nr:universal stress protein [Nitrospirota bacterium]
MISKILVPTDGSKIAQKAAKYAVKLAKETGADILLLSVIDKRFIVSRSISAIASPTHLIDTVEDYLKKAAEAYTKEIKELCKKNNVQSKTLIRTGHPVEEIIKEAEKSKADLIVMGSHGKSALKAAVLGSITMGVIHKDTRIPVLLVRR